MLTGGSGKPLPLFSVALGEPEQGWFEGIVLPASLKRSEVVQSGYLA